MPGPRSAILLLRRNAGCHVDVATGEIFVLVSGLIRDLHFEEELRADRVVPAHRGQLTRVRVRRRRPVVERVHLGVVARGRGVDVRHRQRVRRRRLYVELEDARPILEALVVGVPAQQAIAVVVAEVAGANEEPSFVLRDGATDGGLPARAAARPLVSSLDARKLVGVRERSRTNRASRVLRVAVAALEPVCGIGVVLAILQNRLVLVVGAPLVLLTLNQCVEVETVGAGLDDDVRRGSDVATVLRTGACALHGHLGQGRGRQMHTAAAEFGEGRVDSVDVHRLIGEVRTVGGPTDGTEVLVPLVARHARQGVDQAVVSAPMRGRHLGAQLR